MTGSRIGLSEATGVEWGMTTTSRARGTTGRGDIPKIHKPVLADGKWCYGEGYLEGSATTEGGVGATVDTRLLPQTTKEAESGNEKDSLSSPPPTLQLCISAFHWLNLFRSQKATDSGKCGFQHSAAGREMNQKQIQEQTGSRPTQAFRE